MVTVLYVWPSRESNNSPYSQLSSVSVLHGVANVTELDNFAELLLDTLVSLSLDCGVTLEEDDSSQSSHTLEDEPSDGRVAKSLSSSPQATSIAAKDTAIQPAKSFFIVFTYFPKKNYGPAGIISRHMPTAPIR